MHSVECLSMPTCFHSGLHGMPALQAWHAVAFSACKYCKQNGVYGLESVCV